jgi:hypothetical protein
LLASNRIRCRPPFADEKTAQMTHSIMRLHDEGLISINDNRADRHILPRC